MSVTVLAPTPVLPPVRRPSMWEKMFGNFKMGKEDELEMAEPTAMLAPPSPTVQKTRLASVSTGVDQNTVMYKRKGSTVTIKDRSCSAPLPDSPSKTRAGSISSRRASKSGRRPSWWRSANPDTDEEIPAVPAIDRKFSLFGSHNPDTEVESTSPTASPTASRRPSYVPRNAASSFLRTTTPLSSEEKAEVIRKASVADLKAPVSNASLRSKSFAAASARAVGHKPAPLVLTSDPATHGMHSMAGVCEIDDSASQLVSPRGGTFSVTSGPRSPTDTIMEDDSADNAIDSAKASPELAPTKHTETVAVVELAA